MLFVLIIKEVCEASIYFSASYAKIIVIKVSRNEPINILPKAERGISKFLSKTINNTKNERNNNIDLMNERKVGLRFVRYFLAKIVATEKNKDAITTNSVPSINKLVKMKLPL